MRIAAAGQIWASKGSLWQHPPLLQRCHLLSLFYFSPGLCIGFVGGPTPGEERLKWKEYALLLISLCLKDLLKTGSIAKTGRCSQAKSSLLCQNKGEKHLPTQHLPFTGSTPWRGPKIQSWGELWCPAVQNLNWSDLSCNGVDPGNTGEYCWAAVYVVSAPIFLAYGLSLSFLSSESILPISSCQRSFSYHILFDFSPLWLLIQYCETPASETMLDCMLQMNPHPTCWHLLCT